MESKQEIFTRVYQGLMEQGTGSYLVEPYFSCRYRGPNGTKCAVGLLIKDEDYSPNLEQLNAHNPAILEVIKVDSKDTDMVNFLLDLQQAHDAACRAQYNHTDSFTDAIINKLFVVMCKHKLNWA